MNDIDQLLRKHGTPGVLPDRKRGRPGFIDVASGTWWDWVRRGIAPQPVKVRGVTFWRRSDIEKFIADMREDA